MLNASSTACTAVHQREALIQRRARPAEDARDFVAIAFAQPDLLGCGDRFFRRRHVGALDVLDDGKLLRFDFIDLLHNDGDLIILAVSGKRRLVSAAASDEAVTTVGKRSHDDRLNDAFFAHGRGQLFHLRRIEILAGIDADLNVLESEGRLLLSLQGSEEGPASLWEWSQRVEQRGLTKVSAESMRQRRG